MISLVNEILFSVKVFLCVKISFCNDRTYCFSSRINTVAGSLLTVGLFLILRALLAYFRVFNVSSNELSAGEQHAIILVLELPPKESYKILVSLLSRYGICIAFLVSSVKAEITLPSAKRDLLIMIPSFIVAPVAPVFFARSDPAKSTK